MWQGFRDQLAQGPGFRTDHLYLTGFDTQPIHYSENNAEIFDLLDKTRSAPGVRSAALASDIPLGFNQSNIGVVPEGYSLRPGEQAYNTLNYFVSDGYFETLGVRLLRGRGFLKTDQDGAPLVAVVNTHFAEHYWPKQDAIGKRFHLRTASGPLVEVVGIAETPENTFGSRSRRSISSTSRTCNTAGRISPYSPNRADRTRQLSRRSCVKWSAGLIPSMPIVGARTIHDFFTQRAVKTPNILVEVITSLGMMGLLLAMVGLYALVAYSVSRRSREIGIRMAIGADRPSVLRMVLRQGLVLGSIGAGVGLILSFLACRALSREFGFCPAA